MNFSEFYGILLIEEVIERNFVMDKFLKNLIALSGTAIILGAAGVTAYKAFKKHFKVSIDFGDEDQHSDHDISESQAAVLDPNDEDLKSLEQ